MSVKEKNKIKIIIAADFSTAPGGRERKDGKNSGQEFYENILRKKVQQAQQKGTKVWIDFDGTWGYPPSFISSAFGRLSDKFGKDVMKYLEIKTEEDGTLKYEIEQAIKEGNE